VLIAIAGVVSVTTPGGIDEDSPVAIFVGLVMCGGLLVNLAALGLGIAGLCQPQRKKLFAILGVVTSSVVLLGVLFLMVVGMLMQ
jgi:hypothetical protein